MSDCDREKERQHVTHREFVRKRQKMHGSEGGSGWKTRVSKKEEGNWTYEGHPVVQIRITGSCF